MRRVISASLFVSAALVSSFASAAPRIVAGRVPVAATGAEPRARAVVRTIAPSAREYATTDIASFGGDTIVRFEQTHRGLPVIGRGAVVRLDARGDSVLSTTSFEEKLPASVVPAIDARAAAASAQRF